MKRIPSTIFQRLPLLLFLLLMTPGYAQYYTMGADPAAIRWNKINVRGFNLIYPEKELKLAAKYSRIINCIGEPVTASMQSKIRNLPVILHPYASVSNGSSILAPRRIELFPKQPIAQETNDFASQLIIHEIRHFAQMERLNSGITRVAGFILGEQAQSIVLALHVPTWLLEGDAVLTETLLSHSGRGRIAGFIQPLRSRLIDNKDLSYDRVWFGSYHEILPNEYLFGYFLTARGRMLADPLIWSDALGQIGRNPFNIKSLSGITRPKTGYQFSKLYLETLDWLQNYWKNPAITVKSPDSLVSISTESLEFQNYYRPQKFSVNESICLKKTMGNLPAFLIIDSCGNERTVARPGNIEDAGFSYCQGKLAWTELIQDPRWENRSWSELFVYDFKTGRKNRLTYRQRYFSPVFNPAGDRIAVINELPDGTSCVQIIGSPGGQAVKTLQNSENEHFSFVCWGEGPEELFAITTGPKGRKLVCINLTEMTQEIILDAGYIDIACPVYHSHWVYFTGPAGATQGLYRIHLKSHITEKVFSHPHGINYLSAQGDNLYLSVYSSNGYRPAKISFSSLHGKAVRRIEPLIEPVTSIIQRADREYPVACTDSFQAEPIRKYNKIAHLFKLHSWSPLFINPDLYQINPGMVLMSQNDLSTLTCWAGYQYIKTDLSHNLLATARYTGLYPALEMNYSRKYRNPKTKTGSTGKSTGAYLQFLRFGSGLPLDYSSGAWTRTVQPGIFFEQVSFLQDRHSAGNHSAWMAGVSVSSDLLRKSSYRDLFPKWGASMDFSYFKAFSLAKRGDNITGRVILYVPGLLPNSSVRILNSASILTFDQFLNSLQDFPRGQVVYQVRNSYNLKIDFAFPVSYPDYHLSWLIYIKRIKANLFFDAGTGIHQKNWFFSAGIDLTMDYHLLRSGIALESGIRMMYFPTTRKPGAEFLFSFAVN